MKRLRDDRAGGYMLHVYCKFSVDTSHDIDTHGVEFFNISKAQTVAEAKARKRGCPDCAKGTIK